MTIQRPSRNSAALRCIVLAMAANLSAPGIAAAPTASPASPSGASAPETVEAFLARAEGELDAATEASNRADWVHATNITPDTDWLSSAARNRLAALSLDLAREAAAFDPTAAGPVERRKLDLLRRLTNVPPPADKRKAARLSALQTSLSSNYATGAFDFQGKATSLRQAEDLLAKTRDPEQARLLWEGWRESAKRLKSDYAEMVDLSRQGARELGFADMGELWRAGYDRSPSQVEADLDKDWAALKPLYAALHCFTRKRLSERYGASVQPRTGPIRADLLGNMWSQNWGNIFDIVYPGPVERPDIDKYLLAAGYDPMRMVKTAEGFYVSLGFDPLPASFWTSSQFVEPADRAVDCNPSAWTIDNRSDVRLKMCIRVTRAQFRTVYHELGHDFYNLAYVKQPFLFRRGADEGFHEGIGDFIALSATTLGNYKRLGIVPADAPGGDDIGQLLQKALDEVPLLPFAVALDKWRWSVFAGRIAPDHYNDSWWKLVAEYQGVAPPRPRPADGFDAGAKYHVAENVPYISYLKARLYQYQFHEAACHMAKWKGPLHLCSIYGDKEVGTRLRQMLALGGSRPNSEALALFTGSSDADPRAMLEYYRPVLRWLEKQNGGERCGW
ncbi:M2 family metallopeptidase [Rhizorhabdus histidinilytica]|uniref:Peptidyl-dipeptidase A n=1 Tax=Rhizorhabdus histidinilytica TaxID=439228 RepID=A0A1T5B839_9SPHN|nr:M2 family metallopeptidase [Rhizorhabdus histidinilytica]SKB43335.1 peptidyl-dipeptidase A [Rhizorhabdus histidinilytica]